MKENVVDFEYEYYLKKEKEAKQALNKCDYEKVLNIVSEPIEKIKKIDGLEIFCPQDEIDSAILLNLLSHDVKQTNFSKNNYYVFHFIAGLAYYNLNKFEDAIEHFKKAKELDPADIKSRIFELLVLDKLHKYDSFINDVQEVLYFAYRDEDLSSIYEIVGNYMLNHKDYEMAILTYYISLSYLKNEKIENKLKEIEQESGISLEEQDWLSKTYMKKLYNAYKIPIGPNEKVKKIVEKVKNNSKKDF